MSGEWPARKDFASKITRYFSGFPYFNKKRHIYVNHNK
ncbi:hypothetical protein LTSERUB_3099 [Salmonella enterica subsp. enterica serovar Rubislaw str. A4-653]|uniref:Uncharacterized protein n=1 Tax=Salmonella enterica subsp. enterica serovar Rubislaw str. A4-653 TaxID=913081 RepID=G5QKA3_SALRU|nr:hypothetical protein LTSERUB_3099 [Salmonella enterica subsp. enterica serovar Rubislaw str. A4-653]